MAIERLDKSRPVVYKNYVIHVTKDRHRYIFKIKRSLDVELTGVTSSLEDAFLKAREIIDKMTSNENE